jgi:hypothetical protein
MTPQLYPPRYSIPSIFHLDEAIVSTTNNCKPSVVCSQVLLVASVFSYLPIESETPQTACPGSCRMCAAACSGPGGEDPTTFIKSSLWGNSNTLERSSLLQSHNDLRPLDQFCGPVASARQFRRCSMPGLTSSVIRTFCHLTDQAPGSRRNLFTRNTH